MSPRLKSRAYTRIEGFAEFMKKVQTGDPIYGQPWKRALNGAVDLAYGTVKKRAPVATGALEAGITKKLDVRPVPLWGLITAHVGVDKRGARYGFILQAGKGKSGAVMNYRSGPRAGKKTRKWFSALGNVRKQMNALLRQAAREIESRWRR